MASTVVSGEDQGITAGAPYLRWYRAAAIGFALVFVIFAVWYWWLVRFWPKAADFVSFWAAGRLALAGQPGLAYDIAAHHAAEQAVGRVGGLLPFPYPPPFLAIVTTFALLPFGPAFYLWVVATGGLYAWATRRIAPLPYAFAMPPAYINLLIGQTGFLMSGILISGLSLIRSRPLLAGCMLGLMLLKPQLALLLPIAMLCGREWRVVAGAALSASALLLATLLLFGWGTYQAFLDILPRYVGFMRESRLPWNELASPFALARYIGIPQNMALGLHVTVAGIAALQTARAWWLRLDQRVPVLAAATLLIPPYLLTYDALLMIVPAAWLLFEARHRYVPAIVWLLCFCPLLSIFTPLAWPNVVPLAAVICLCVLHWDERAIRPKREQPLIEQSAFTEGAPAS